MPKNEKNKPSQKQRSKVPTAIEEGVIVESRRRCCICFGLLRDFELKPGQIAHLDKKRTNNNKDNLAFLCFVHHDEYDSKTSQRKNYTIHEVKNYRKELHRTIEERFESGPPSYSQYTGGYLRLNDDGLSAQILVSQLLDGRFHISAVAVAGESCRHGVLEFTSELNHNEIVYSEETIESQDGPYQARFIFYENGLSIVESETKSDNFGAFIGFDGKYKKIPRPFERIT